MTHHEIKKPEGPAYTVRPFPRVELNALPVDKQLRFMLFADGRPLFAARPARKARAEKLARQHRHSEIARSCGPWEFQGYLAKSTIPGRPSVNLLDELGEPNGKKMQTGFAILPLSSDQQRVSVKLAPEPPEADLLDAEVRKLDAAIQKENQP